jgi:hypothetical protein
VLTDYCDFELHEVHGEGARFVAKDILDLTELLVQRGCFDTH